MSTEERYVVRVDMKRTGYSAETMDGALEAARQVTGERGAVKVEVLDNQTGQSLFLSYPKVANEKAPVFASHEATDWRQKGDDFFKRATNENSWTPAERQAYAMLALAAYARAAL